MPIPARPWKPQTKMDTDKCSPRRCGWCKSSFQRLSKSCVIRWHFSAQFVSGCGLTSQHEDLLFFVPQDAVLLATSCQQPFPIAPSTHERRQSHLGGIRSACALHCVGFADAIDCLRELNPEKLSTIVSEYHVGMAVPHQNFYLDPLHWATRRFLQWSVMV